MSSSLMFFSVGRVSVTIRQLSFALNILLTCECGTFIGSPACCACCHCGEINLVHVICECFLMLIFTAALCERHKATEKSAKLNFQVKEVLLGKKKSLLSTCVLTKIQCDRKITQIFNVERFRVYRLKLPQQHPLLYG